MLHHIDWTHTGIDVETFLRDYWQQKPLFIKGGLANYKADISPDELAGLACEEEVESRIVIEHGDTPWQLLRGPFDDEQFASLPESHWTLLVQSVDLYDQNVSDLLSAFRFLPNWRLDDVMISFAVEGGSVGPHFDQYDVFLLQGMGSRLWQVGPICDETSPRVEGTPLHILSEFNAIDSHVCEQGDILYLPPGHAHFGVAQEDCMTFSVGFRAPSVGQLLDRFAHFAGENCDEDKRFTDAKRALANPGRIQPQDIAKIKELILEQLQDDQDIALWFGEFMTEQKTPLDTLDEPLLAQEIPELMAEYSLMYAPGARLAFIENEIYIVLFANGESILCDTDDIDMIEALCAQDEAVLTQLKNETDKYSDFIATLVNFGVLSVE
jgi:50S ribosomal protein L16 3-hydroxylase